jgi:phosphopantothenoylcysteine decarboxylase/phosphopantothenate--cysteine ligase
MNTVPHVLVSAGPTREYIDPVRFISNPSSGATGYAVAAAAQQAGCRVTLVSGPVALTPPPGVECVQVVSAEDMRAALSAAFDACDILIMTAAVGDYRPAEYVPHKLHKTSGTLTLELVRTPDILGELSGRAHGQTIVGFAAETDEMLTSARRKLDRKQLDLVVANDVGRTDAGFGQPVLDAALIFKDGREEILGLVDKYALAAQIVCETLALWRAKMDGGS